MSSLRMLGFIRGAHRGLCGLGQPPAPTVHLPMLSCSHGNQQCPSHGGQTRSLHSWPRCAPAGGREEAGGTAPGLQDTSE